MEIKPELQNNCKIFNKFVFRDVSFIFKNELILIYNTINYISRVDGK